MLVVLSGCEFDTLLLVSIAGTNYKQGASMRLYFYRLNSNY